MRRFSFNTVPLHELTTEESDLVWNEGAKDCFYGLKDSMSTPAMPLSQKQTNGFCLDGFLKVRMSVRQKIEVAVH